MRIPRSRSCRPSAEGTSSSQEPEGLPTPEPITKNPVNEAKRRPRSRSCRPSAEGTASSQKPEESQTSELITKRIEPLKVIYKGKLLDIPPLFQSGWSERNEDRTLLNDTLIEFYMCQYMWEERYDDDLRRRVHVFNTFFYDKLQTHLRHHFGRIQLRKSELGTHYNRMFQKAKPGALLNKEILVIPCHLKKPKHWFLVIVHNPSGAILRRKVPVPADENNNQQRKSLSEKLADYVEFEERQDCRIIIMDSLCHSRKFGPLLANAHNQAFDYINVWLQMAAAAIGEDLMAARIRKVVCQTLPKQTNGVDCGIFMMAYAEYFTFFNREWTKQPTDSLVNLKMDDESTRSLSTDELRHRLEKQFHKYSVPTP